MQIQSCLAFPWFVGLAVSLASAHNESEKGGKAAEPVWGPPLEGFQLSLRFSKAEFATGEKIKALIVIKNVDSKDRVIVLVNPLANHELSISLAKGKALSMTEKGKALVDAALWGGSLFSETLKPGEESSEEIDLFDLYDLKAGEYRIFVRREVLNRDDMDKISKVVSNTVVIKVTEPPPKKGK